MTDKPLSRAESKRRTTVATDLHKAAQYLRIYGQSESLAKQLDDTATKIVNGAIQPV